MRILIDGYSNFLALHFVRYLLDNVKDAQVYLVCRALNIPEESKDLSSNHLLGSANLHIIADPYTKEISPEKIVQEVKPEMFFYASSDNESKHCVSARLQSSPVACSQAFQRILDEQLLTVCAYFEALRKFAPLCKVLLPCSADIYAFSDSDITELSPLSIESHYSLCKLTADLMAFQYFKAYSLPVVRIRSFKIIGANPKLGLSLFNSPNLSGLTGHLAQYCAKEELQSSSLSKDSEKYKARVLEDLSALFASIEMSASFEDYLAASDLMQAYWLALLHGKDGEVYNVSSGKGLTALEVCRIFADNLSFSLPIPEKVFSALEKMNTRMVGDHSKFTDLTGWKPQINFDNAVRELLQEWRNYYRSGSL